MGELDPIRAPEKARFFRTLCVGVFVVLGLIMFMAWWLQAPFPRALIVLAIAAVVGWVAGKVMFRKMK